MRNSVSKVLKEKQRAQHILRNSDYHSRIRRRAQVNAASYGADEMLAHAFPSAYSQKQIITKEDLVKNLRHQETVKTRLASLSRESKSALSVELKNLYYRPRKV